MNKLAKYGHFKEDYQIMFGEKKNYSQLIRVRKTVLKLKPFYQVILS